MTTQSTHEVRSGSSSSSFSGQQFSQQTETPEVSSHLGQLGQRSLIAPGSLTPADVMSLQRTIGNQAVIQLLAEPRAKNQAAKAPANTQADGQEPATTLPPIESKHKEDTVVQRVIELDSGLSARGQKNLPFVKKVLPRTSETAEQIDKSNDYTLLLGELTDSEKYGTTQQLAANKSIVKLNFDTLPSSGRGLKTALHEVELHVLPHFQRMIPTSRELAVKERHGEILTDTGKGTYTKSLLKTADLLFSASKDKSNPSVEIHELLTAALEEIERARKFVKENETVNSTEHEQYPDKLTDPMIEAAITKVDVILAKSREIVDLAGKTSQVSKRHEKLTLVGEKVKVDLAKEKVDVKSIKNDDDLDLEKLLGTPKTAYKTTIPSTRTETPKPEKLHNSMADETGVQSTSLSTTGNFVQRRISGASMLANGKKLEDLVVHFNDIQIVQEDSNKIDLTIGFASAVGRKGSYALTGLYCGNELIDPATLNASNTNKPYEIRIQLNKEAYDSGQNASSLGSLYATLAHEWELHGRQHAINILRARMGQSPIHIDHAAFFEDEPTGLDDVITKLISHPENAKFAPDIYSSYLNDTVAHINFMQEGWVEGDNQRLERLWDDLKKIYDAVKLFNSTSKQELGIPPLSELYGLLDYHMDEAEKAPDSYQNIPFIADVPNMAALLKQCTELNLPETQVVLKVWFEMSVMPSAKGALRLMQELQHVFKVGKISDEQAVATRQKGLKAKGLKLDELPKFEKSTQDKGLDFKKSAKKND